MISFPTDNGGFLIVEVKQFISEYEVRGFPKDTAIAICHLHEVIDCEKFKDKVGKELLINFDFK